MASLWSPARQSHVDSSRTAADTFRRIKGRRYGRWMNEAHYKCASELGKSLSSSGKHMPKDAIEPFSIMQEKDPSISVALGRVELPKDKECEQGIDEA